MDLLRPLPRQRVKRHVTRTVTLLRRRWWRASLLLSFTLLSLGMAASFSFTRQASSWRMCLDRFGAWRTATDARAPPSGEPLAFRLASTVSTAPIEFGCVAVRRADEGTRARSNAPVPLFLRSCLHSPTVRALRNAIPLMQRTVEPLLQRDFRVCEFWRDGGGNAHDVYREVDTGRCITLNARTGQLELRAVDAASRACVRTSRLVHALAAPPPPRSSREQERNDHAPQFELREALQIARNDPVVIGRKPRVRGMLDVLLSTPWEPLPASLMLPSSGGREQGGRRSARGATVLSAHSFDGTSAAAAAAAPAAAKSDGSAGGEALPAERNYAPVPISLALREQRPRANTRHASVGILTVRRYMPPSHVPAFAARDTLFDPAKLPLLNADDGTVRAASASGGSGGGSGGGSDDSNTQDMCLTANISTRAVSYAPCTKSHNDPLGQEQVWYAHGQRLHTALSDQICLNANTRDALLPCPARNASCGAVYGTVASLLLSLWRTDGESMYNVHDVHLFTPGSGSGSGVNIGGVDASSSFLNVFSRNVDRFRIHTWDNSFVEHLVEINARLSQVLGNKASNAAVAASFTNYYSALYGMHRSVPRERDLVVLEDDVKSADDAWINTRYAVDALERDALRNASRGGGADAAALTHRSQPRVGSVPPYIAQLYVPEASNPPLSGWRYAMMNRSRLWGTQAMLYPAAVRTALVAHYRDGMLQAARAPDSDSDRGSGAGDAGAPKYDIHLHDFRHVRAFGLARSAFEHAGCASTGLGAGAHRSRTWTPTHVHKRRAHPLLAPASDQHPSTHIVMMDDGAPAAVRYASLSSLLAAMWSDSALDALSRVHVIDSLAVAHAAGDGVADTIAHHEAVRTVNRRVPPSELLAMMAPDAARNENRLTLLMRHRRGVDDEAFGFADGWYQRMSLTAEVAHRTRMDDSEKTLPVPARLFGIAAAPRGTHLDVSARDAHVRMRVDVQYDAARCAQYSLLVVSVRNATFAMPTVAGSDDDSDDNRGDERTFVALCRAFLDAGIPVAELSPQHAPEMAPRFETVY